MLSKLKLSNIYVHVIDNVSDNVIVNVSDNVIDNVWGIIRSLKNVK